MYWSEAENILKYYWRMLNNDLVSNNYYDSSSDVCLKSSKPIRDSYLDLKLFIYVKMFEFFLILAQSPLPTYVSSVSKPWHAYLNKSHFPS
jgi:hypothetical protein